MQTAWHNIIQTEREAANGFSVAGPRQAHLMKWHTEDISQVQLTTWTRSAADPRWESLGGRGGLTLLAAEVGRVI